MVKEYTEKFYKKAMEAAMGFGQRKANVDLFGRI
jgi:hypothetical protein